VQPLRSGRFLSFRSSKRPVAVLIRQGDVTCAYEVDGAPVMADTFDRRYPGQRALFEQRVAGTNRS